MWYSPWVDEEKKCKKRDCENTKFGKLSLCRRHYKERKRDKAEKAWYVRVTSGTRKTINGKASPLKREALKAYGEKCEGCGQSDPAQLQLDHLEDNGLKHRLIISNGRAGAQFYRALKKLEFPNKEPYQMQVICFDCHITTTQRRRYEQAR